ncbi:HNH endonuclease [Promicromonospora sp. NPDC050880]|uniref:HNH endonuclease n=1 Tax=Promicromonospora sp. NPDC050880 TaxID=3364406 RepID=UPI0037887CDF
MILPGASDTSGSGLVSREVQGEWVDVLGELEAVKAAVTATQARLVVALDEATRAEEAAQGVRVERRGRGVSCQVGAALRVSPHAGSGFVSTSRVWVMQMPHTFAALEAGVLSQWRATLLVRETSHLSVEHRALIDEQVCGPARLGELARMGTRRLVARIKELAASLDVHACVNRNARAVSERRVSIRPAPDLMVYLTALVPMGQGVQAYAHLKATAESVKAAGDGRGAGQIMADTLIERVTGRGPGRTADVPVAINLLVSDDTLLAGGTQPGVITEGAAVGGGVVPAPVARNLAAHAIDTNAAWLRSIYTDPHGRLVATTSTSRFHPQGLAGLLRARGQGVCATAWCDAPIRHLDHITPHIEGGETSLDNGQGLCARCNHAKQAPGWVQKSTQHDGRHAVETTTPTGHTHLSVAPMPPTPLRTDRGGMPARINDTEPDRERNTSRTRDSGAPADSDASPSTGTDQTQTDPRQTNQTQADQRQTDQRQTAHAQNPPTAGSTDRAQNPAMARDRTPAPEWTPAVGMTGPAPGRIPRSRYTIGCHTTHHHGAIAYRPATSRGPSSSSRQRSARRRRAHGRLPDLSWAHWYS